MRALRIATVGLGVTLACVAAGAVAGMVCATVIGLIILGPRDLLFGDVGIFGAAATIGGICGLVVGPLAAFGFLRRVPLGRLFMQTALGATLGGLLGYVYPIGMRLRIPELVLAAVAGFAVAVAHLAWRFRAAREPAARALAD